MIQGVVKGYPVEEITEDDNGNCCVDTVSGEEVDVNTNHVDTTYAYHCGGCGYALLMEDDMPVQEDKELVQWIKDNCEQE